MSNLERLDAQRLGRRAAMDLTDFLAQPMPSRDWIVEPLIQVRDAAMVHAWRGIGKSRFGHGVGVAVAAGGQFLRYTCPKPRGVLLVDGELPREQLQEMLAQQVAAADAEPVAPFLVLASDMLEDGLPSLASEEGQALIDENLSGGDVELVIFDSISTLCRGDAGENEAESWSAIQSYLLSLRRRGLSSLWVHHDGKGGSQRGTSAREDVLSQVVQLRRPSNYRPSEGCRFEVHVVKARGVYGEAADPFEATFGLSFNGEPVWSWRTSASALRSMVKELADDGLSQREIARELGLSKSTVNRHMKSIEGDES